MLRFDMVLAWGAEEPTSQEKLQGASNFVMCWQMECCSDIHNFK